MPVNLYKTHIERSKHLMNESMCLPTHEQRMKYFDNMICGRSEYDTAYYIACYLFVSLVFELPPDDEMLKDPGLTNLCSRRLKAFMGHISKINWPVNNSMYMKYLDDCKHLIAKIHALKDDSEDFIIVGSVLSEGDYDAAPQHCKEPEIISMSRSRDSSPKRVIELSNPTGFKCFVRFHDSTVVRCLTMSHKPSRLIKDRLSTAWEVCRQNVSCYLSKVIIPDEFIEMVKNNSEIVNSINTFNATMKTKYIVSVFDDLVELESQNDWFYQLYMILHMVDEPIAIFMYILVLELESKNLTHMLNYQLKDLVDIFMKRSFEKIQEYISPEYVNAILELQGSLGV